MTSKRDFFRQRLNQNGDVEFTEHSDGPMHTFSEATPDGARVSMSGRPQQNEEGVRAVCERLAKVISEEGPEKWTADDEAPLEPEAGVDWYLRSNRGGVWGAQVTRVGLSSRWKKVAKGARVSENVSMSQAASEIWAAIEGKIHVQGGMLALSVGQPGMHTFRMVVDEFRRTYGRRVRERVQFSEVWLVGYSPETTLRIHPDRGPL